MNLDIRTTLATDEWQNVADILRSVGMGAHSPEKHKKAFEASYCSVFLYHQEELIGFGRALSDGQYQAAIYDCAVKEKYQKKGCGKIILQQLLERLVGLNIILYASPGKEGFYEKLGFRRMKTGMASFVRSEYMKENGFTR